MSCMYLALYDFCCVGAAQCPPETKSTTGTTISDRFFISFVSFQKGVPQYFLFPLLLLHCARLVWLYADNYQGCHTGCHVPVQTRQVWACTGIWDLGYRYDDRTMFVCLNVLLTGYINPDKIYSSIANIGISFFFQLFFCKQENQIRIQAFAIY